MIYVNSNCLDGIQCPHCLNEDSFKIAACSWFRVYDSGTDDYEDVEWDESSGIKCLECNRVGTVGEYTTQFCQNCHDGSCQAIEICDGCNEKLCEGCLNEHNKDGECHDP